MAGTRLGCFAVKKNEGEDVTWQEKNAFAEEKFERELM